VSLSRLALQAEQESSQPSVLGMCFHNQICTCVFDFTHIRSIYILLIHVYICIRSHTSIHKGIFNTGLLTASARNIPPAQRLQNNCLLNNNDRTDFPSQNSQEAANTCSVHKCKIITHDETGTLFPSIIRKHAPQKVFLFC